MDVGLLELQKWVPGDARLLELLLLVLLVDTAVHPKAQGACVKVKVDAHRALCGGYKELVDSVIGGRIVGIARHSKF